MYSIWVCFVYFKKFSEGYYCLIVSTSLEEAVLTLRLHLKLLAELNIEAELEVRAEIKIGSKLNSRKTTGPHRAVTKNC